MTLGFNSEQIGTEALDWWRLKAIIRNLPQGSALHRAYAGTDSVWGLAEHLLATIVDTLQAGNWQRGGGKGKRPQPIPRPGAERKKKTKIGGASMPLSEAREWLNRRRGHDGS